MVYASAHRYKAAIDSFKQAIRLKPELAEAHFSLGAAHLALKERDEALEEYSSLKFLDPNSADELYRLIYKDMLLGSKPSKLARPKNY